MFQKRRGIYATLSPILFFSFLLFLLSPAPGRASQLYFVHCCMLTRAGMRTNLALSFAGLTQLAGKKKRRRGQKKSHNQHFVPPASHWCLLFGFGDRESVSDTGCTTLPKTHWHEKGTALPGSEPLRLVNIGSLSLS